jgi:hypothetical protein
MRAELARQAAELVRCAPSSPSCAQLKNELGLSAPTPRLPMRFELPAEKTLVFDMVLPMRWGDMDAYGHINNTVYFRYFESLRVDWLLSLGRPLQDGGMGPWWSTPSAATCAR